MTMNVVQDTVNNVLPARRKKTDKWISFNAVCCPHNGESADTRSRGGVINSSDGAVSYHCFNCGFKTSWRPGWNLSYKFRKLLKWLGAEENTIQYLVLEAIRIKDTVAPEEQIPATDIATVHFVPRPLPAETATIDEWATMVRLSLEYDNNGEVSYEQIVAACPPKLLDAVDYLHKRKVDLRKYQLSISDDEAYNMHKRVIVPFTWQGEVIGYTGRSITDDVKPKFHNSHDAGYVFGIDHQLPDAKFVIIVEGPFDAMSVDGVAVLGSHPSETQIDIIDNLSREVIVVPDFDKHVDKRGKLVWPGAQLIDTALDCGWSVSFPVWRETCKDVNEAVVKYGKLFVIKSILDSVEKSRLKIELLKKRIHTS
jgi:hypothetical protein